MLSTTVLSSYMQKKTTSKVLTQTQAFQVASNGSYMMNVLPCDYEVKLIINGFPPKKLGTIQVFSDSKDGTLNDFLLNPAESEITPEVLQQVVNARNAAKKSADDAKKWASTIDTSKLLKTGDYGLGSNVGVRVSDLNEKLPTAFYYTTTDDIADLPFNGGRSSASLLPLPTSSATWGIEMLSVVNSKTPKIFYRCSTSRGKENWYEAITTANSTVDSNGFLKKASPILRLFANDNIEEVGGFKKSGCALVNDLADGVTATRIDVGHYEIHGSSGFAKEGWYITLPEDANGNKKFFAEYSVDENNIITVKTYTKKFDFESCQIVAGKPIDITDGRWIDVRLEMPVVDVIENEKPIPSTLNPIVIREVSDDI